MTKMIDGYRKSCCLVRERLSELNTQLGELRKNGNNAEIEALDLERRISLLYAEHRQMQEIIGHLTEYMRRIELRVKTKDIL